MPLSIDFFAAICL